ncbi:hypothetical protein [Streptomyces sp. NPDC059909]|uniref:hypothetical protein n=1 Tax=Streptomyces sp. NPDC059909 TaxID=3346998 RepID=UPI003661D862
MASALSFALGLTGFGIGIGIGLTAPGTVAFMHRAVGEASTPRATSARFIFNRIGFNQIGGALLRKAHRPPRQVPPTDRTARRGPGSARAWHPVTPSSPRAPAAGRNRDMLSGP